MQTHDGLLRRRILPTLLGLTLLGGLTAAPAFAQKDRDHKMHHSTDWDGEEMMFDPAPMSYPQAAPGSLHLYHWKDYTQTKMSPGSATDKRWDNEHKKDKKRHDRAAYFHKTRDDSAMTPIDTSTTTLDVDTGGSVNDRYSGIPTDSPWSLSYPNDVVLWPDPTVTPLGEGFVYVLRGNTLYQMRADDMSLQSLNSLPWLNNQPDSLPDYSQPGNDLPPTAESEPLPEDWDVYNKTFSDIPATGNIDTERTTSDIQAYPDYPPDMATKDETSDLNVKTYYHRSSTSNPGMTMKPIITASGDFIYVLRGNTLYQLRVSDLSLVNQEELPESP